MGVFSKFERKFEDGVEGAASAFEKSSLTPLAITKKAEKEMRREKVVGRGRQIAPTLYTCLVSPEDDDRLFGYYPTLAGEVETYLQAKAGENGLALECKPLVRFVPDPDLHKGKFDIIAELVAAPTIAELRAQEFERYGIPPEIDEEPAPVPKACPNRQQVQRNVPRDVNDEFSGLDVYADDNYQETGYEEEFVPPVPPAASESERTQVVPKQQAQAQAPEENVFFYDEENDIAYTLTGAHERIGRESTNEIVVSDINASRTHAEVFMDKNGDWIVRDLGSTNGLFVNGRKVSTAKLIDTDIVLVGTTRLEFQDLRK